MNDWERAASIAAASVLLWSAWKRPGTSRRAPALAAVGLLARGASGYCPVNAMLGRERRRDDTKRALGGGGGVFLRERININAPANTLFKFWQNPANLPRVMPYLERVIPLDAVRSHWVMSGPAGARLEWDAEIINKVPNETIGWQSLPGADVASAGSVRFRPNGNGRTEVTVTMQYDPPAGRLGASLASLVGPSASTRVRRALEEFKRSMEAGLTGGATESLVAID
jgi:uncharacterized membrane protein